MLDVETVEALEQILCNGISPLMANFRFFKGPDLGSCDEPKYLALPHPIPPPKDAPETKEMNQTRFTRSKSMVPSWGVATASQDFP